MAEKKVQPKATAPKKSSYEPTYTYDEIASQADAMGEPIEVLAGALIPSGKTEFTKSEIKRLIHEFKTKEVK